MSTQLYARVFTQILDSSLAEDWQARHVFEDLLKLAEGGMVDMTRPAIARRTNVPLDVIDRALTVLEAPDPHSRDAAEEGRRLVRLDAHRDWGWRIVNWEKYAAIRSTLDQRAKTAERVRRFRERNAAVSPTPPSKDIDIEEGLQKRYRPLQGVTKPRRDKTAAAVSFDFPAALNGEKFRATWQQWVLYRTSRTRIKGDAQEFFNRQLSKCAELGLDVAVSKLELAMLNNWQGFLFEDKPTRGSAATPSPANNQELLAQCL